MIHVTRCAGGRHRTYLVRESLLTEGARDELSPSVPSLHTTQNYQQINNDNMPTRGEKCHHFEWDFVVVSSISCFTLKQAHSIKKMLELLSVAGIENDRLKPLLESLSSKGECITLRKRFFILQTDIFFYRTENSGIMSRQRLTELISSVVEFNQLCLWKLTYNLQ